MGAFAGSAAKELQEDMSGKYASGTHQVEELKLLSTAEKLGLLSLAEKALTSDPGAITSASIVPFLAAIGARQLELCTCWAAVVPVLGSPRPVA